MAKKIVKKRKLKILNLLLILIVLGVVFFAVDLYLNTSIKNITIKNTTYLNDQYILETAEIDNYPSFYYTTSKSISNKLLKTPYIKSVKVHKGFYHTIVLDIREYRVLFLNALTNKYVLENGKEIESNIDFRVPRLTNIVEKVKYKKLREKMLDINKDIQGKISEIEYVPNDYDKDRFLLYMDDGNSVYLTLTKFKKINYYNDVLEQLEGKKGILYLDSGNHFKIME